MISVAVLKTRFLPYLFVAIGRITKFCIAKLYKDQTSSIAVKFLQKVIASYLCKITKILTDNGLQFTHRKGISKVHGFTALCKAHGIAHRLTN